MTSRIWCQIKDSNRFFTSHELGNYIFVRTLDVKPWESLSNGAEEILHLQNVMDGCYGDLNAEVEAPVAAVCAGLEDLWFIAVHNNSENLKLRVNLHEKKIASYDTKTGFWEELDAAKYETAKKEYLLNTFCISEESSHAPLEEWTIGEWFERIEWLRDYWYLNKSHVCINTARLYKQICQQHVLWKMALHMVKEKNKECYEIIYNIKNAPQPPTAPIEKKPETAPKKRFKTLPGVTPTPSPTVAGPSHAITKEETVIPTPKEDHDSPPKRTAKKPIVIDEDLDEDIEDKPLKSRAKRAALKTGKSVIDDL